MIKKQTVWVLVVFLFEFSLLFNFPDAPSNDQSYDMAYSTADQQNTDENVNILSRGPPPTDDESSFSNNSSLARQSLIPGTSSTNGQTCICVPIGTCNTGGGTNNPTLPDGTGIIDIRIQTNPPSSSNNNNIIPPINQQTSCTTGLVLCCQIGTYQCGIRYPPVANSPIAGVGQAPYGAYPWQAAILSPGDVYVGSGALITQSHVLSAAHRIANFVSNPTSLKVRLGDWNAAVQNEPFQAQDFTISRIITHPNFNSANLKNDVSVMRLATSVNLGAIPTIGTACLPASSFAGTRCWVSGWGRNDFASGSFQAVQKQVQVPILQNIQCQSSLAATRLGSSFVFDTTSFICAGGELGQDACTGDGGSPLVCSLGGRWLVAGLVAWGIGCGTTNVPGVYVNVQSYVPWIQQTVSTL